MGEPRWLNETEQRAWRGLLTMHTQLTTYLAREMAAESDMSMADFAVLVALTDNLGGRVRAYALAESLGWEKSRLSHQLARMAGRGLIERADCSEDARGQVVCVTPAGRAAIEAAAPAHVENVRRVLIDVLTPAQIKALTGISETVLAALDRERTARG
ncbi:MAG TPA: helix-turn-helix domain-containing protein [Sporichthyaceae bacterium]|jgi:DNA-binding MarR family transcriptional regulator|nr:helix-turn-helix domain-containing protein [Sporichthyaceae bacterium]